MGWAHRVMRRSELGAVGGLIFGELLINLPLPLIVSVLGTLVMAGLFGAINGQIVLRTRLPSFIVTLAFLFILRGLSLVGLKLASGGNTLLSGFRGDAVHADFVTLFSGDAFTGALLRVHAGKVLCLLGGNGAGKSTLIKTLSGVRRPSAGEFLVEGNPITFQSPRGALDAGIATVYQDLAMIPLISITRNFFMGCEPTSGFWPFRRVKFHECDLIVHDEMRRIGIDVRDPTQAVGTLSGGERQCVAIARAVYFGAKVLILDEPTSALGVAQTSMVLKYINQVRAKGLGVIFITHNVRHAYEVGDRFTVLNRGRSIADAAKAEISIDELQTLMAGGKGGAAGACRNGACPGGEAGEPRHGRPWRGGRSVLDQDQERRRSGGEADGCEPAIPRPQHLQHGEDGQSDADGLRENPQFTPPGPAWNAVVSGKETRRGSACRAIVTTA
jgi:simple sugar transport system ATP-binding protein